MTTTSPYHISGAEASPAPQSAPFTQPPSTTSDPTTFQRPTYASFPPFYTLQPNLTTRARQLELWASYITAYCRHHSIFRISLSSPPADLFTNPTINRSLKPSDVRLVLDHLSTPQSGKVVEWIPPAGGQTTACYIWWRTVDEWADLMYAWVEESGQKGAVLTLYELREGDAVRGKEWKVMDEGMLRKVLAVLVKRGKAQIFAAQGEGEGVKFF